MLPVMPVMPVMLVLPVLPVLPVMLVMLVIPVMPALSKVPNMQTRPTFLGARKGGAASLPLSAGPPGAAGHSER